MTLNDLNGVIPYLAFILPNSMANYVTVIKGLIGLIEIRHRPNVRKILSPHPSLPLLAKTNPPCSAVSLRQLSYLLALQIFGQRLKRYLFKCHERI